jgi:hypothetical protein
LNKIVILLQVDYGAEEYLWETNFLLISDVLEWCLEKEHVDVYKEKIVDILGCSNITQVDHSLEETDIYNKSKYPIKIMLENDHCSYLTYEGKRYYHKGYLGFKS